MVGIFYYSGGDGVTENDTVRAISEWPVNGLTGRRKIYTAKKKVTPENVVEVLGKALAVHRINRAETVYLYDFYKGKQDIRLKDKIVRPEINNKVMINRANEIVTFWTAQSAMCPTAEKMMFLPV